jgi:hypothetical protein
LYILNVKKIDFAKKTCDNTLHGTKRITKDNQEGLFVRVTDQLDIEELDLEWAQLILSAREIGLKVEDIRTFLRSPAQPLPGMQFTTNNKQMYAHIGCLEDSVGG